MPNFTYFKTFKISIRQPFDSMSTVFVAAIIAVMVIIVPLAAQQSSQEPEHDALEYEVSVKALQVPFVAVDSRGNPVYDLKAEELEIIVNRKAAQILFLNGFAFSDAEIEEQKTPPAGATTLRRPPKPVKKVYRQKFIIIDALFNSSMGLTRSKDLARKLVLNAAPEDLFVLLEIRLGGLHYIAGPEPGGETFFRHFEKLRKNPQKLHWWDRPERQHRDGLDVERYLMEEGMRNARRDTVQMYMDAFQQFKNALRTIDGPKVTYLLSEGFADQTGGSLKTYRDFQDEISREIHDGGSVLQKLHVGGVRPDNATAVVKWMNRSTSAYYELFFNPGTVSGENMNIDIKCKRPGVQINAVGHKEKEKPYQKMNKVQKKLFAMSVATGRSYSKMLGRVTRIPYKKKNILKRGSETQVTVDVTIPENIRNKKVDIFIMRFDSKYQDADVAFVNRVANANETLTLPTKKKKKRLYFVVVEPESAACIYNEVNY
jgi:hypothetical protein